MDNDYGPRLAATLQAILRRDGLEIRALADRLGRNYEVVRRWVAGEAVPRPDAIADLADALEVPYEALLRPPESQDEVFARIAAWRGVVRASRKPAE